MNPETTLYSQNYIMQTIRLSRSNWELLDDFEKGKAMALGNEYPLFKAMISDPANVSLQKQRTEQARQDLVNQRRILQGKNNDLLNQINEGKQREKNLSSALEQKEKNYTATLEQKEKK